MFLHSALNRSVWECEPTDPTNLIYTITTPEDLLLIRIHSLNPDTVPAPPIRAPYPPLNADPPFIPIHNLFFPLLQLSFLDVL